MTIAELCVLAYLLGSIPFGVLVGKYVKGVDLSKTGSGNIGAANTFRNLGLSAGLLVLAGDILKGTASLFLAWKYFSQVAPDAFVLIGLCAILGHLHSCFLRFKGGKGVATTVGIFLFISWKATLAAFSFWGIIILCTRYASLASLTASLALPVFLKIFGEPDAYILFASFIFAIILFTHRSNIQRLLTGKENKLTFTKEA